MVRVILWLFDRIAFLIRLSGADYGQFRAILQAKLLLDNRRQTSAVRTRSRLPQNMFVRTLAFYGFMGIFPAMTLLVASSPLTALTLVHAFIMVMVGMSLVADFTSVLIDTTDLTVLGPRPVSGRTLLAARLAHICTYLGLLALAVSAGTLIMGSIAYRGLFPLVYLGTLICSVTLVVFGVNLFLLVTLRFMNIERFKDLIVYFQVGMFVVMFGGYQILPRLIDMKRLRVVDITGRWWTYLFPPSWFGGPVELLASGGSVPVWLLTAEAVIVPLVGLFLVVRFLAPRFSRSLLEMDSDVADGGSAAQPKGTRLRDALARRVARTPGQRMGFDLVWAMSSRDRQLKTRIYPQLTFPLVWPVVMLFVSDEGPAQVIANLGQSRSYLFLLYLVAMSLLGMLFQIQHSSQFEAAWVYYALPVRRPGEVMVGALQAMIWRFGVPIFALFAVVLGILVGPSVLPGVVLALIANGIVWVLGAFLMLRNLPFSQEITPMESGGRFGFMFLLMLFPCATGGLHYLLTFIPYAVPLAIVPAALLYMVLIRAYGRRDWDRFDVQPAAPAS